MSMCMLARRVVTTYCSTYILLSHATDNGRTKLPFHAT